MLFFNLFCAETAPTKILTNVTMLSAQQLNTCAQNIAPTAKNLPDEIQQIFNSLFADPKFGKMFHLESVKQDQDGQKIKMKHENGDLVCWIRSAPSQKGILIHVIQTGGYSEQVILSNGEFKLMTLMDGTELTSLGFLD